MLDGMQAVQVLMVDNDGPQQQLPDERVDLNTNDADCRAMRRPVSWLRTGARGTCSVVSAAWLPTTGCLNRQAVS